MTNCQYCGAPTLAEHEFCRACGMALAEDKPRPMGTQIWGLAMLMLMFVGITIAMAGKMFELKWLAFTGLFICLAGMFMIAALAMFRKTRPRKHKPRQTQHGSQLPVDTTNKLLPIGDNDFIPSVTEATTNLLKTPVERITKAP